MHIPYPTHTLAADAKLNGNDFHSSLVYHQLSTNFSPPLHPPSLYMGVAFASSASVIVILLSSSSCWRHCKSHTPNTHTPSTHTHMFIICNFHLFICILLAPQNLQQLVASFVAVEGEREGGTYMVFPGIKRGNRCCRVLELSKLENEDEYLLLSQGNER